MKASRIAAGPLRVLASFVATAVVALATPAIRDAVAAGAHDLALDIAKFAYTPKEITVPPNTKVVWTNRDTTPHTVTSVDKTFASGGLDTGDTYEHVFTTEGDFNYLCTIHPYMTGVVHVRKQ